jgi:glutathione S-transferase
MSEPYVVYGTYCSYYTCKLIAYLRAKGIQHRLEPFNAEKLGRCARHTGVMQIPQVQCDDGTWLVDTTKIIAHLERERPEPQITPTPRALRFISLLLEDYADEWLWRPAMHYRWSFPESARLMCGRLAEHLDDRTAPFFIKKLFWRVRQTIVFVKLDGINSSTRVAAEASYLDSLESLEAIFRKRPFILGERPSDADFGFFASMYAHFFCDPASGRIMRERAPAVHEWVARMWNLEPAPIQKTPVLEEIPEDLDGLMRAVATIYLPYLEANAKAYAAEQSKLSYRVQDVQWKEPVKPYRVWCLNELRRELASLDTAEKEQVRATLNNDEAFAVLDQALLTKVPADPPALPIPADHRAMIVDSWWRKRRIMF